MPNNYVLICVAKLAGSVAENEGVFDQVTWTQQGSTATLPDPATAALVVNPNDQIAFAVQVYDGTGNLANNLLQWIAVSVSASTQPGNRGQRLADNNSPFRIGTGNRPNTVLLARNAAQGSNPAGVFAPYQDPQNVAALGTALLQVYADIPPGSTSSQRPISQYEAVVTCSINAADGQMWQFTFDPEVDVQNGN